MKTKKILALLLAGTMAMSLAGCSIDLKRTPKTAPEVIEKYMANMDESRNYHVDMGMEFGIGATGQGITLDLPITMDISADVLDDSLHGDMEMHIEFMGQEMDQKAEVYMVKEKKKATTYLFDEEAGHWTVSEDDTNGADTAISISGIDPEAFVEAEMEYDKEEGTYIVTQSLADFAEAGDTYELLSDVYSGMAEMMSMDPDDFMEEWEDAEVVWVFDKDFYLQAMNVTGCEFSDTIKEDGMEMDVSVSLALSYEFSDYGKITEKDVEVPDDIVKEAVPSVTLELEDVQADVEEEIDYDDREVSTDEPLDPMILQGLPAETDEQATEEPVEMEEPISEEKPVTGGAQFGFLNGNVLTLQGDPWSIFADDGWVLDTDNDGEYSFAVAGNPSYPDAQLYVNNEVMDHTTIADIEAKGIFGYTMDFMFSDGPRPDISWNGITFGASVDDVTATYGKPYSTYQGSMYESLSYEIGDAEICFYVTPDKGLQKVSLNVY